MKKVSFLISLYYPLRSLLPFSAAFSAGLGFRFVFRRGYQVFAQGNVRGFTLQWRRGAWERVRVRVRARQVF